MLKGIKSTSPLNKKNKWSTSGRHDKTADKVDVKDDYKKRKKKNECKWYDMFVSKEKKKTAEFYI